MNRRNKMPTTFNTHSQTHTYVYRYLVHTPTCRLCAQISVHIQNDMLPYSEVHGKFTYMHTHSHTHTLFTQSLNCYGKPTINGIPHRAQRIAGTQRETPYPHGDKD